MKLFNLSLLAAAILSAAPLAAVDLQSATNQQLVDEVGRRLSVAGPGSASAVATYTCDSSATLHLTVFNSSGTTNEQTVYVGDAGNCTAQANVLNSNRTQINGLVLAAACDSSGTLHRFPITTAGTFGTDSTVYVGDVPTCIAQAKQINSGN